MMKISLKISDDKLTEITYKFNTLKKFEIRTERPTKNKPTHLSGFFIQLIT
jgi:hypothetical protein